MKECSECHMDPYVFWTGMVGIIVALVIYGMISSRLRQRKIERLRREAMPVVPNSVRAGVRYAVFLSNGRCFKDVTILGLTEAKASPPVDFPLEPWLVLEQADGKRVFVKPASVRHFEEL